MKVNWFLNKDEESGDVYIFVSGDRARCMNTKEILDAVQNINYGSTANDINVIIYKFLIMIMSTSHLYFEKPAKFNEKSLKEFSVMTNLLGTHKCVF